jgi:2-methylaconitate cis-trans-isomerase PrpF
VKVQDRVVDTAPNCGNMLSGVAPFAIQAGLVRATTGSTTVRIHNVNTGKIIEARVMTPDGTVTYDGDTAIDGVPGTAAPIHLAFLDAAGSKTGKLLPTGAPIDCIAGIGVTCIAGIGVTCIDAAIPMVLIRAADLGKTGHERPDELDSDPAFLQRLEAIRIQAGERMGLTNVANRVIPKPVLLSLPCAGGTISARYFMPHLCHKALAITGGVGIATACVTEGTIAQAIAGPVSLPLTIGIEHPSGRLDVLLEADPARTEPVVRVVRTARRLFEGTVFASVPETTVDFLSKAA